jgi:hypothetical protein
VRKSRIQHIATAILVRIGAPSCAVVPHGARVAESHLCLPELTDDLFDAVELLIPLAFLFEGQGNYNAMTIV